MKKFSFFRSVLLILLALALVMSMACFAGCDRDDDDDDDDDDDRKKKDPQTQVDADDGRDDFIDDIGGVSDTFRGAVSEESYDTPEDAAVAFVESEVVGSKNASIVDTVSKGELSNSEIADLDIPADLSEGMQSVELMEVEYTVSDASISASSVQNLAKETASKTYKVKVYVIKYTIDWKYFVPMPVTGETISKSYYDSVFNSEKFANCTYESTNTISAVIDAEAQGQKQKITMDIEIYQIVKYADNKVYFEQRTKASQKATGMEDTVSEEVMYAYMEEVDGEIITYVKTGDGGWMEGELTFIGLSSMKEMRPFYNQYLDYTYFTREDYGFKLGRESAREYMRQALGATPGFSNLIDIDTMDIDMYAEYYVNEGALSGMRTDAVIGMEIVQQGTEMEMTERVTAIATCTNYGTTVVENPMK